NQRNSVINGPPDKPASAFLLSHRQPTYRDRREAIFGAHSHMAAPPLAMGSHATNCRVDKPDSEDARVQCSEDFAARVERTMTSSRAIESFRGFLTCVSVPSGTAATLNASGSVSTHGGG